MKRIALWTGLFALAVIACHTGVSAADQSSDRHYTVDGLRHGRSFFPRVVYAETRPLVPGEMDFKHYHTYDEVNEFLKKWSEEFPDLIELYTVAESFEGRPILQITITNRKTGRDTDKPAMFLEGNRHSGEVTAAESALYFAWYVLTNYGKDPEITRLVDTKALYIRVKNNPDGSLLYLSTAQSNRSTVRPHDGDRDGLLDEDPNEDLDGDGFCFQVRKRFGEGKGDAVIDPDDPSGRLMKRVGPGRGEYRLYSEGTDDDGDGRYNEDGIGGLDLHRNYPENWRPEPGLEMTGRGWTQRGAGAYPLSEIETRSVVTFLLRHPNISIGQTMDTTVPMHLRPPSTSRSEDAMFPEDLELYKHFDEQGKTITGYPAAGDVFWDYANLRPRGEPRGRPLFGHSPDFGYLYYGAIWYGDELWCGGRVKDYDGDGAITQLESLRWNDEELDGKGFKPWKRFMHPQLGEVEIGGFNPKFFRQNPPASHLEEWARKQAMFNLMLAKSLPQVEIVSVEAWPVKNEDRVYDITAVFTNTGFLPTALKMAHRVKIVRPDRARLSLPPEGMDLIDGESAVELGYLQSGEKKQASWRVRVTAPDAGPLEVEILSTRGGVASRTLELPDSRLP